MKCKYCGDRLVIKKNNPNYAYCYSCRRRFKLSKKGRARKQRRKCIILGLLAVLLLFVVFRLISCHSAKVEEQKAEEQKQARQEALEKEQENAAQERLEDGVINFSNQAISLVFDSKEITKDSDGNDCIVLTFNFTNYQDEAVSFTDSVSVTGEQNSEKLERTTLGDGSEDTLTTALEKDTTAQCKLTLKLNDLTSPVTITAFSLTDQEGTEDTQELTVTEDSESSESTSDSMDTATAE